MFIASMHFLLKIPPIKAVLGGFSRASKVNGESAFTNQAIDEQICFGSHVEQFGQLLITLLGHCHGSSKQFKVNKCSINLSKIFLLG